VKKTIAIAIISGALGLIAGHPWTAHAQKYEIGGWPIKKAWGAMRGSYVDPKTQDFRIIFEDTAGTVRIVTINPEAKTAVPVVEMRRE
jgi:hypothetical protein